MSHGPVILPYILKTVRLLRIIIQNDRLFDLRIKINQNDLYLGSGVFASYFYDFYGFSFYL